MVRGTLDGMHENTYVVLIRTHHNIMKNVMSIIRILGTIHTYL